MLLWENQSFSLRPFSTQIKVILVFHVLFGTTFLLTSVLLISYLFSTLGKFQELHMPDVIFLKIAAILGLLEIRWMRRMGRTNSFRLLCFVK